MARATKTPIRCQIRLYVCLHGTGVHCDHTCSLARMGFKFIGWIVQCSGHPDTKACPPISSRHFPAPPGREVGYGSAQYV